MIRNGQQSTATDVVDLDTAPIDARDIIVPGKVFAVTKEIHETVKGSVFLASISPKSVRVDEGKRKIPRTGRSSQEEEAEKKSSEDKNEELSSAIQSKDGVLIEQKQDILSGLSDSCLFEDDLASDLEPEIPGPYDPERPQRRYRDACKLLNIVPSRCFYNGLRSGRVTASYQGMGPLGGKAVAYSLLSSLKVTELFLTHNRLGPKGMKYVAELIHDNEVIKVLDVSDNELGREGAKILAAAMRDNGSIHEIRAAGNRFDDKTGIYFEEAFRINSTIRQVDLSRNLFSQLGAINIANGFEENTTVTHLDLSYNHIRRLGIKGISKMLLNNETLMQLDLSWNGIDIDGAGQLGQGLNLNNTLFVLNLSGCRLTVASLMKLLGNMRENKALKTLQIPDNPLTNADLMLFLRAIDSVPDLMLSFIDASTVKVSQELVDLIAKIAKDRPGFMVSYHGLLSIRDCSHNMLEIMDLTGGDPLEAIVSYARRKNLRLLDIFARFDADKSGTVTRDELIMGVADAGIPLSIKQLDRLVAKLDTDGDGEVDFAELLNGYRKLVRRLRKEGKVARNYLNEEAEMFPGLNIKETSQAQSERLEDNEQQPHSKLADLRVTGKQGYLTTAASTSSEAETQGDEDSSRRVSYPEVDLEMVAPHRIDSGRDVIDAPKVHPSEP